MELQLTIEDHVVRLEDEASLDSLHIRYGEPRELRFATPKTYSPRLNDDVQLAVDGVVRFLGTIIESIPDPRLANNNVYVAVDLVEKARDVQVNTPRPNSTEAGELSTFFNHYRTRADTLAEFLELAATVFGPELAALGITDAASVFSGTTVGQLPVFSCRSGGVPDMLNSALTGMPGYRWLWRPQTKRFHISNVFAAAELTLNLPADVVPEIPLTVSMRDRYSRVTLVGSFQTLPTQTEKLLIPAWGASLEPAWTINDASAPGKGADPDPTLPSNVYRMFSFAQFLTEPMSDQLMEVLQFVPYDRHNPATGRWISVEIAAIDWANGLVWTKHPALLSPNDKNWTRRTGLIPGKSQGAVDVAMRYIKAGIYAPPVASVGPEGNAYTEFGLDRELVLYDYDNFEVTTARAQMLLDNVKDVIISGTIPLWGDLPDALWDLDASLNVLAQGVATGLEGVKAIVSGVTYRFAGGGRADIEIGTDRSQYSGVTTV